MSTYDSGWRVAAMAARGARHEKSGAPCQDAHGWRAWPNGMLAIAVADGAGSASLAEVGSAVAVQTALAFIHKTLPTPVPRVESLWRAWLGQTMQVTREAVVAEAMSRHRPLRDLATTLLLILASRDLAVAAQVGDGAAVVNGPGPALAALTRPPSGGEYLNETLFLTSAEALNQVQYGVHDAPVSQLAAFSDGLQMLALKMPGGIPHGPFFHPLWRLVEPRTDPVAGTESLARFFKSPRLLERTDDDLTLVLAAPV